MTITPLILSFSGLLRSLIDERLSPNDLCRTIYFLGSTQEEMMDGHTWATEIPFIHLVTGAQAYTAFRNDVFMATQQHRIVWARTASTPHTWEGLNELLTSNGLQAIQPPANHRWIEADRYCYPAVTQIVREQKLPYQVIW
ncbi:MAG: hypothetical protein WBP22_01070 [Candidatus Saccharimonas sp.]